LFFPGARLVLPWMSLKCVAEFIVRFQPPAGPGRRADAQNINHYNQIMLYYSCSIHRILGMEWTKFNVAEDFCHFVYLHR
jgi:hypothetical protein